MLCVYILENLTGTTRTYVGFTVDLRRRLRKHNREIVGGARATEGRLWKPFLVITGFHTKKCGLQLEWRVKHPPRTWSQPRSTTPSKGSGRRRRRRKNHSKSIIFPKAIFPQAKPSNIYKDKYVKVSCAKLPKKLYLAHAVCAILHLDKWTKNAIPLAEQGDIVLHWDDVKDLESIKAPWPENVQHRQFDWDSFKPQAPAKTKCNSSDNAVESPISDSQEPVLNTNIDQNINARCGEVQLDENDAQLILPCTNTSTPCPEIFTPSLIGFISSPKTDSSISPETPHSQDIDLPLEDSPLRVKSKNLIPTLELPTLRRSPRIKRLSERLSTQMES